MSVIRYSLTRGAKSIYALSNIHQNQHKLVVLIMASRNVSTINITKNMTLLTNDQAKTFAEVKQDKPLCIMHSWLLAQPKHIRKFADIYLDKNFDVLNVRVTPWQLLWPSSGSQVIARELLHLLSNNYTKNPLYLHGFSVGAYLWSESLVWMAAETERYKPFTSRFVAQVWDSAADINDIPIGFPKAVFPKNRVMENATRNYILYHMKTFDKVATCHYIRASQMFHTNFIRCPSLFMVSSRDRIGPVSSNKRVREAWEAQGMEVYWKDWNDSSHVGHFLKYNKEYKQLLNQFLDKASEDKQAKDMRMQAKQ